MSTEPQKIQINSSDNLVLMYSTAARPHRSIHHHAYDVRLPPHLSIAQQGSLPLLF